MRILEFDNVLLDGAREIRQIAGIVARSAREDRLALVVPAWRGVPEELQEAARDAAAGVESYPQRLSRLRDRHIEAVQALFAPRDQARVVTPLQIALNDLEDVLRGVQLVHECTCRTRDLILSFGVLLGCVVVNAFLAASGLNTVLVDAREIIRARLQGGKVRVDRAESDERIRRRISGLPAAPGGPAVPVITGGIASLEEGMTVALGGEEYTAFLVGSAVQADLVEIWTDVDGVMSADPRHVPQAYVVEELNYQEAMEMSYFGARILNPQAMIPAVERGIPIRIRDGRSPAGPGTRIAGRVPRGRSAVRGIASIDRLALVNIEGGGMIGIPGVAARVFGALARAAVNIMMISQASSEHSICLVFRETEAQAALGALEEELKQEIESGSIEKFDLLTDLAIVAAIGEDMRGTPGISGRLFSALGDSGVNVLAIAQGSSERNISLVVEKKDEGTALRAIHRAFLEEPARGR